MAAAQALSPQQASTNRTTGIAVSIVIVLLIVIAAHLMHRLHWSHTLPTNLRNLQPPRQEKTTRYRTLEKLPILTYNTEIYRHNSEKDAEKGCRKSKKTYSFWRFRRFQQAAAQQSVSQQTSTTAEEPAICSICVSAFLDGESVRVLPCRHIYHHPCIDDWLMNYLPGTCPLW